MTYTVSSSKAEWDKAGRNSQHLNSVSLAMNMEVGDYTLVFHQDSFCDGHSCNLRSALARRPGKWHFKHEGPGIALLWREK